MIVLKWNPIQWGGWVLAFLQFTCSTHALGSELLLRLPTTCGWTLSRYNLEGPDRSYQAHYRDKANALALQVNRDGSGNVAFADFDALAGKAGEGFQTLTYDYFYPPFSPVPPFR